MNREWRVFQFFKEEQVCEPGTADSPEFLEKLEVTCSSSGGGFIIFGDNEGWVSFVKRNFQVRLSTSFSPARRDTLCAPGALQIRRACAPCDPSAADRKPKGAPTPQLSSRNDCPPH